MSNFFLTHPLPFSLQKEGRKSRPLFTKEGEGGSSVFLKNYDLFFDKKSKC